jgi:hypothetical protein
MARSSWPDVGRQSIWDDFLIPTDLFGLFWAGLKHELYLQCFIPRIRCSVMIKIDSTRRNKDFFDGLRLETC